MGHCRKISAFCSFRFSRQKRVAPYSKSRHGKVVPRSPFRRLEFRTAPDVRTGTLRVGRRNNLSGNKVGDDPNNALGLWHSPSGLVATDDSHDLSRIDNTSRLLASSSIPRYEPYSASVTPSISTTSAIRGTLDEPHSFEGILNSEPGRFGHSLRAAREPYHYVFAPSTSPGAQPSFLTSTRLIAPLSRSFGSRSSAASEASTLSPQQSTPSLTPCSTPSSGSSYTDAEGHWYPPTRSLSAPDYHSQLPTFHEGSYPFPIVEPESHSLKTEDEWRKRRSSFDDDEEQRASDTSRSFLFSGNGSGWPSSRSDLAGLLTTPAREFATSNYFEQPHHHQHAEDQQIFTHDVRTTKHRRLSLAEFPSNLGPSLPIVRRESAPTVSFSRAPDAYRSFYDNDTHHHHPYSPQNLPLTPPRVVNHNSSGQLLPSPFYDSSAPTSPNAPDDSPHRHHTARSDTSGHVRRGSYPEDTTAIHREPPQADFAVDADDVRKQKLRFPEDHYTPLWVRKHGHAREGWCALCPGNGKWLVLKNSQYWYHRQFQHGVSSVSGHFFLPPVETKPTEAGDKTEGLCHSCGLWVPYQNSRQGSSQVKGPTLWYRHAHGCHSYFSPRREATKQVRMLGHRTR